MTDRPEVPIDREDGLVDHREDVPVDHRPEVPIDRMSPEEFVVFRRHYLDPKELNDESLNQIKQLFGVGDDRTGRINCDEAHRHQYLCNEYNRADTAIVDRLLLIDYC